MIKITGLSVSQIWDLLETGYKINIEKITKKAALVTVHSHINDEDVTALINALTQINSSPEVS